MHSRADLPFSATPTIWKSSPSNEMDCRKTCGLSSAITILSLLRRIFPMSRLLRNALTDTKACGSSPVSQGIEPKGQENVSIALGVGEVCCEVLQGVFSRFPLALRESWRSPEGKANRI